jgi:hypothetical protein
MENRRLLNGSLQFIRTVLGSSTPDQYLPILPDRVSTSHPKTSTCPKDGSARHQIRARTELTGKDGRDSSTAVSRWSPDRTRLFCTARSNRGSRLKNSTIDY